jgi:hypothetical protein
MRPEGTVNTLRSVAPVSFAFHELRVVWPSASAVVLKASAAVFVPQTSRLLYRGFPTRMAWVLLNRLEVCDAAGWETCGSAPESRRDQKGESPFQTNALRSVMEGNCGEATCRGEQLDMNHQSVESNEQNTNSIRPNDDDEPAIEWRSLDSACKGRATPHVQG